jgi:Na+/glutamate symporter
MRKPGALLVLMTVLLISLVPALCFAGGEGLDMPEALDQKVPLEGLTGVSLFFARTYNENLLLYAVYCTLLMAVVGVVIAYVTDIILKTFGMEVHKISHKE